MHDAHIDDKCIEIVLEVFFGDEAKFEEIFIISSTIRSEEIFLRNNQN